LVPFSLMTSYVLRALCKLVLKFLKEVSLAYMCAPYTSGKFSIRGCDRHITLLIVSFRASAVLAFVYTIVQC
jgi:hypothetical protein